LLGKTSSLSTACMHACTYAWNSTLQWRCATCYICRIYVTSLCSRDHGFTPPKKKILRGKTHSHSGFYFARNNKRRVTGADPLVCKLAAHMSAELM
jgi:hypothetical protein